MKIDMVQLQGVGRLHTVFLLRRVSLHYLLNPTRRSNDALDERSLTCGHVVDVTNEITSDRVQQGNALCMLVYGKFGGNRDGSNVSISCELNRLLAS